MTATLARPTAAHAMRYTTLKRSAEFKRVRGGVRCATPLFIVEGKARFDRPATGDPGAAAPSGPRFGFTITKKVGGAVVRNRIRRRLKEALRAIEPQYAHVDFDYVVVASRASHDYPFAELQDALRAALQRLDRLSRGGPASSGSGKSKRAAGAKAGPEATPDGDERSARRQVGPSANAPASHLENDASQPIRPQRGRHR